MPWYTEFKFLENPLDARPNPNLVGLEEEEEQLTNHIKKEELCFLNGLTGSGKTSLLQKIQNDLKEYSFIYLDAQDLPKNFDLEQELKKKRNFFDKIRFKKFPAKKPVLIIDEFQATDPNLILEAKTKWDAPKEKRIRNIIIAQIDPRLKNVSGSFLDRLGNRIITLKDLDEDDMKEILKRRLHQEKKKDNCFDKLSPEAIDLLVAVADGNVRRLLEYTDLIFDFHHRHFDKNNPLIRSEKYKVSFHAVKEILERSDIVTPQSKRLLKKIKTAHFEELFDRKEQTILKFLFYHNKVTYKALAQKANLSLSTIRKTFATLKKKNAVYMVGKKGRETTWQITQGAKRLMIEK